MINKFDVSPYLDEDLDPFGKKNISYPYPSKIPNFALNCLIKSIKNLKFRQHHNSLKLKKIIKFFNKKNLRELNIIKKIKIKILNPSDLSGSISTIKLIIKICQNILILMKYGIRNQL